MNTTTALENKGLLLDPGIGPHTHTYAPCHQLDRDDRRMHPDTDSNRSMDQVVHGQLV
jgi:hypothetical protein